MNVTGNILAARSCVVSHGRCRVITTTRETARSPPSTATKERRAHPTTIAPSLKSHPPPPRGLAIATSAAAAGACVLCHSVRLTAACSATSAVQRQFHSPSGHPVAGQAALSSGGADAAAVRSTASIHSLRSPDSSSVALAPASEGTASKSRSLAGASKWRSFALPSPPLPSGWLFFQCRDGTPRPFRGGLRAFHHRCRRRHCGESWRPERWCWLRWAVGCF
mmetsp:Transcript_682/g.1428  ORF Transcript_682/g.1428 Transcript_682/m.1428 type:complete len:222 (+) Transcript_682:788-1453(+)